MPENPFATPDTALALDHGIDVVFRSLMITVTMHEEIATHYAIAALDALACVGGDQNTGARSVLWTVAEYLRREVPELRLAPPACDHAACATRAGYEIGFIEAAYRGEHDAALNVAKVLIANAPYEQHVPALLGFAGKILVAVADGILTEAAARDDG